MVACPKFWAHSFVLRNKTLRFEIPIYDRAWWMEQPPDVLFVIEDLHQACQILQPLVLSVQFQCLILAVAREVKNGRFLLFHLFNLVFGGAFVSQVSFVNLLSKVAKHHRSAYTFI